MMKLWVNALYVSSIFFSHCRINQRRTVLNILKQCFQLCNTEHQLYLCAVTECFGCLGVFIIVYSLPILKNLFLKGRFWVLHFHTPCILLDEWLIVATKIMGKNSLFYMWLKWATIQLWPFCMLSVHIRTISIQKYNSLLKRFESL